MVRTFTGKGTTTSQSAPTSLCFPLALANFCYHSRDDNVYYSKMNDSRGDNYHHQYPKPIHNDRPFYSMPAAGPPPRPPKVHWPPSPSVEDESVSLSREHSPSLPELNCTEVQMRGSIDQQPILLEIGKENDDKNSQSTPSTKKKKGVRFETDSSDESTGPPTPTDSIPSEDNRYQRPRASSKREALDPHEERRSRVPLASPSIQDVLSNSVRPRRAGSQLDRAREDETRYNKSDNNKYGNEKPHHTHSSHEPKHSDRRDYFAEQDAMHHEAHYPGTLEELRNRRRGESKGNQPPLPFAERHRTMSGSSDAADHRPSNMRHMSAMGYYGESQTPSYSRDHPGYLHTSPPPEPPREPPRSVPQFRAPRPSQSRKSTGEDSDSDSDLSPDEAPHKEKRRSRNLSNPVAQDSQARTTKGHDYPVKPQADKLPPPPPQVPQQPRPVTPVEQHRELPLRALPDRLSLPDQHDGPSKPARSSRTTPLPSPASSPRNSHHTTPPSSPRPDLKDRHGSKEGSPTATKNPLLPKVGAVATVAAAAAAAIPLYPAVPQLKCADEGHHRPSNTRNHSRPSSPTLHPPGEGVGERHSRANSKDLDDHRSRHSLSPLPAPTPSRVLRPDLKIDVQGPTPEPTTPDRYRPRPELRSRPVSGDFSSQYQPHSPSAPTSAPFWGADQHARSQWHGDHHQVTPQSAQFSAPPVRPQPRNSPSSLPACPRPGFVTGYSDWWTLRNAPDLDICPSCKENLIAAGSSASFVPSPPRSTTYRTRCDLSNPWVRMAWLLVLQGKASKTLVKDVIMDIAHETPCPGRAPAVRNWRRLYDTEKDRFVPNFDVCPSCVRCVESVFPNLRGRLEPVPHTDREKKRTCSLSFEHPRFARYVDLLDEISTQAHTYRREPNMLRFVTLARSYAEVPPCRRDDQFRGVPWHFIPHLPDLTVCEECYLDVIWPAAHSGSELAKSFSGKPHHPPHSSGAKLSCQLYSVRMRDVFQRCCGDNDFQGLRREALMRVGKERELQARVARAQELPMEWRASEMEGLIAEWRRWE